MDKARPTEHLIQTTVVAWFDRAFPKYRGRLFAIPNGAHLAGNPAYRAKQMHKLKAEGLRVGVPDLMLPVVTNRHAGLFIEMKREKGSRTSQEQKDWMQYLNDAGYKALICKGTDDAIEAIKEYLKE